MFQSLLGCDLLENTYLCGSNNNKHRETVLKQTVVICLKIRTFVVATTTAICACCRGYQL